MATDFGSDLSCTDDLDPNARELDGEQLVAEAIYRRLTTPRGALIDDPDYGLDVRSFLHKALTPSELQSIAGRIRTELLKDETIDDVQSSVTAAAGGQEIFVNLIVTTGQGPFRFVFSITAETVSLLQKEAA